MMIIISVASQHTATHKKTITIIDHMAVMWLDFSLQTWTWLSRQLLSTLRFSLAMTYKCTILGHFNQLIGQLNYGFLYLVPGWWLFPGEHLG